MSHEQHTALPVWDPIEIFREIPSLSPRDLGLFALAVVAVAAFFPFTLQNRPSRYFAPPLFLSLVPFIVCSFISYFTFYNVISIIPGDKPVSGPLITGILSIQYPFQLGVLSSGFLLLLHSCAY